MEFGDAAFALFTGGFEDMRDRLLNALMASEACKHESQGACRRMSDDGQPRSLMLRSLQERRNDACFGFLLEISGAIDKNGPVAGDFGELIGLRRSFRGSGKHYNAFFSNCF